MDRIRLPVAADSAGDMDTKSGVASPRYFTNSPHGVRSRKSSIAPESLGCLSLLDKGDKVARPRAVPSPGLGDENSAAYARIQAQPTVHVHRPRAVLSSPENDELSAEIQGPDKQGPDKHTNAGSNVPKAPLSPLEELPKAAVVELPKAPLSAEETLVSHSESTSLGLSEISAVVELPKAPLSSETSAVVELPKAPLSSDESMSVSSSEISSSMIENIEQDSNVSKLGNLVHNNASEETKLQPRQDGVPDPTLAKRNSIDNHHHSKTNGTSSDNYHHSKTNGTSRIVKKHSCLPSNSPNVGVKQKPIKSTTKGNNGRVIRPWY